MEAIVNNLIKATGWSIFHSLWQGVIIYGLLLLLVSAFPKLNAKIKHNLAYAAICAMFAAFCITFAVVFKLPVTTAGLPAVADFGADTQTYLTGLPQKIGSYAEHFFPYLVSVYCIGLLFQLFILAAGYWKLLKLRKDAHIAVPADWRKIFERMVTKLNLHQKISFHLSAKVNVPLVIGYLKPVVLFPVALATQLDFQQVEAILIHELSHIRRNDYLLNLIKTAIETILFFNPFIWLSGRFINIEREHACDDLVLKFTGAPVTYAHALLKLEILKEKASPALSMAATGNNQYLYQRIKRITDMKTNYMNAKHQIFAFALTIATVASLAWISPDKASTTEKLKSDKERIETRNMGVKQKMMSLPETKFKSSASRQLVVNDTTKKKKKIKIVTVDANGTRQEYNSVKEMPDSLRKEVINEAFLNDFKFDFQFNDSLTNASLSFLKSPEFKEELKKVTANAAAISKQFNSPEWKKQQEEIVKNAMEISKKFNSAEWKKQQREIFKNSEKLRKRFSSLEFKKKIEEMKELQNSPEYKELKKKFDKEIEDLKKKKGIKSDLKSIRISNGKDFKVMINDALAPLQTFAIAD